MARLTFETASRSVKDVVMMQVPLAGRTLVTVALDRSTALTLLAALRLRVHAALPRPAAKPRGTPRVERGGEVRGTGRWIGP